MGLQQEEWSNCSFFEAKTFKTAENRRVNVGLPGCEAAWTCRQIFSPTDGGIIFLLNIGISLQIYTESQLRTSTSISSPPQESQISYEKNTFWRLKDSFCVGSCLYVTDFGSRKKNGKWVRIEISRCSPGLNICMFYRDVTKCSLPHMKCVVKRVIADRDLR
jgi:hypothetical protein